MRERGSSEGLDWHQVCRKGNEKSRKAGLTMQLIDCRNRHINTRYAKVVSGTKEKCGAVN
jgi:hypothetical protein